VIVAFDNTFLTLALNPSVTPRPNPATGQPVSHCRERIEALIDSFGPKDKVLIPTPVLAEVLCVAEDCDQILTVTRNVACFDVVPFDARSAYELAQMTRAAIAAGDKKDGEIEPWQLIKLDRQIVAIAKAHGAKVLYSDDIPQSNFAIRAGLEVRHTWNLELPDTHAQLRLEV
jgi:predicted nucleic acid-binding protein